MWLLSQILSFETLFVLFLGAGILKRHHLFTFFPVDITALFFAASVVAGIIVIIRRGGYFLAGSVRLCLYGSLLAAWIAISYFWSDRSDYGRTKALYALTLMLWPLLATTLVVSYEKIRVRRFGIALVALSLFIALDLIREGLRVGFGTLVYMHEFDYLGNGRFLGLAAGSVFLTSVVSQRRIIILISTGLFFLFFFVMSFAGGRGPMLAAIAGVVAPIFFWPFLNRLLLRRYSVRLLMVGAVLVLGIVFLVGVGMRLSTISRAKGLLHSDRMDSSSRTRTMLYKSAFDGWRESKLVGKGAGGFSSYISWDGQVAYPHNIFLEVAVEQGLVGLGLLLATLAAGLAQIRNRQTYHISYRMFAIIIFSITFLNAQFTADITGNRMLFAALGLLSCGNTGTDFQDMS